MPDPGSNLAPPSQQTHPKDPLRPQDHTTGAAASTLSLAAVPELRSSRGDANGKRGFQTTAGSEPVNHDWEAASGWRQPQNSNLGIPECSRHLRHGAERHWPPRAATGLGWGAAPSPSAALRRVREEEVNLGEREDIQPPRAAWQTTGAAQLDPGTPRRPHRWQQGCPSLPAWVFPACHGGWLSGGLLLRNYFWKSQTQGRCLGEFDIHAGAKPRQMCRPPGRREWSSAVALVPAERQAKTGLREIPNGTPGRERTAPAACPGKQEAELGGELQAQRGGGCLLHDTLTTNSLARQAVLGAHLSHLGNLWCEACPTAAALRWEKPRRLKFSLGQPSAWEGLSLSKSRIPPPAAPLKQGGHSTGGSGALRFLQTDSPKMAARVFF